MKKHKGTTKQNRIETKPAHEKYKGTTNQNRIETKPAQEET